MNVAFSECAPTVSVETGLVATPAATVDVPSEVAPSKNCTVPAAAGATVAVNVTAVPTCCGLAGVGTRVVVVGVAGTDVTVYESTLEVDPTKAVGSVGVKVALIECVAIDSADMVVLAVPPATVAGAPSVEAPSKNCTVPAALGATVAVKVTDVPETTGLTGSAATDVVVATAAAEIVNGTALDVELPKALESVGVNFAVERVHAGSKGAVGDLCRRAGDRGGAERRCAIEELHAASRGRRDRCRERQRSALCLR